LRARRILFFALVDLLLSLGAIGLAIVIRFEGDIPPAFMTGQKIYFFSIPLACVLVFYLRGLYEKVWRYAGMHELLNIVGAVSISLAPFLVYSFLTCGRAYPRSIIVIAWFTNIFFLGGIRFLLRLASEYSIFNRTLPGKRVLIVGANDIGEMALRELQRQKSGAFMPVGFIDDDPSRCRMVIHGVPVLGKKEDLPRIIRLKGIEELIIALSSPSYVRDILALCEKLPVRLKIIPSLSEILDGKIAVNKIREVQIEDLLERAPVCFDLAQIATYIKDRRVLVTGAGGSIGSEICRQVLALAPRELLLLGHGENSIYEIGVELSAKTTRPLVSLIGDIRDRNRMKHLFARHAPQVIFHAAAHKHVPLMEQNSIEAAGNNILGTLNLVELSLEHRVEKFIFLSTDKAVNPVSVMGASKKIAEMVVLKAAREKQTSFIIVRFGNVLGSRGSVIPTFKHQIQMGGPVTVTHADMKRYFMTIPEAVHLVLEAGALGSGGEIYILDMGKPVRIMDLARNMIRLSGLEVDKDIRIEVKGVRSGEKMEEELVNYGEDVEETTTCKIIRVKTEKLDIDMLDLVLRELYRLMESHDEEAVRALIFSCTGGSRGTTAGCSVNEKEKGPGDEELDTRNQA